MDSSLDNASERRSQLGWLVGFTTPKMHQNQETTCNVIRWKSGKSRRVVNSTLAGETGSCCDCLGEMEWLQALWHSLAYTDYDIRLNQRTSRPLPNIHQIKQVLSKDNPILSDPQAIVVTDAKSLYDHLSKESQGGQDRRTGLE